MADDARLAQHRAAHGAFGTTRRHASAGPAARRYAAAVPSDPAAPDADAADLLWTPPPDVRETTRIGAFLRFLERERGLRFPGPDTYGQLWEWSVTDLAGFWSAVWEHFEVRSTTPYDAVLPSADLPGASWFPGARLSYAEHALRGPAVPAGAAPVDPTGPALVAHSQSRPTIELSWADLRDQVARVRAGLARLGVGPGDRVAAYLPNVPEAVVALLATASLGAVFTSCAPEFGVRSVVDRFAQVEPVVLLAVDGYRYGGRAVDRRAEVAALQTALPSLRATVLLPYLDPAAEVEGTLPWAELCAEEGPLEFVPVPFDQPLYVLYSSGTTGLPKAIVHGHGGILLEHLKALALQMDLGPGDRFFWFTTTGWMMWNYLVSGLLVGATVVLFDGDPGHPDLGTLWRMAAQTRVTYFGHAAPYYLACRKAGLRPGDLVDLSSLRGVGSTGAPLPPEGFRWVYDAVRRDVLLMSFSGGTDVCTGFVGGSPLLPVRAGRIAGRCLGARVEAYDAQGRSVVGQEGELVITAPMPSMPVGFWGDPDGRRYREAYFSAYEGVWRHGDWVTIHPDGSVTISGRSDSTLNRGGVRIGTAEFYRVVEEVPGVADSLVVHLEDPEGGPGELVLFVVPAPGAAWDEAARARLVTALRTQLSPRHVPDAIHPVPAIPRTLTGKKLEVPVKRILTGAPVGAVASKDALADPAALDAFVALARTRTNRA